MAKIELNKKVFADLENTVKLALMEVHNKKVENEEIPFQTGELQESAEFTKINNGMYRLTYDPIDDGEHYAADMYYISSLHPEWHLHRDTSDPVKHHGKTHKKFNSNAKEKWLDEYINDTELFANIFIDCLKQNVDWLF